MSRALGEKETPEARCSGTMPTYVSWDLDFAEEKFADEALLQAGLVNSQWSPRRAKWREERVFPEKGMDGRLAED